MISLYIEGSIAVVERHEDTHESQPSDELALSRAGESRLADDVSGRPSDEILQAGDSSPPAPGSPEHRSHEHPNIPGFGRRLLPPESWQEPDSIEGLDVPHHDCSHGFEQYCGVDWERDDYLLRIVNKELRTTGDITKWPPELGLEEREYWFLYQVAFAARTRPPKGFDRAGPEERLEERYRLAEALHCLISWQLALYKDLTGQEFEP